jgi:hypothetical protein
MLGIYQAAVQVLASRVVLSSTELVSQSVMRNSFLKLCHVYLKHSVCGQPHQKRPFGGLSKIIFGSFFALFLGVEDTK